MDVAQDVIVREEDCGTDEGIDVGAIKEVTGDGKRSSSRCGTASRAGWPLKPVVHPQTGEVIIHENQMIDEEVATAIEDAGVEEVAIRSVLGCRSRYGVCARCYGRDLATGQLVEVGRRWASSRPSPSGNRAPS